MEFLQWLENEMNDRGWGINDLARRAGLSSGGVSMVLSRQRGPGSAFCTGIARAFGIPPEEVFRRAGILPPEPELTAAERRVVERFRRLPEQDRDRIEVVLEGFLELLEEPE